MKNILKKMKRIILAQTVKVSIVTSAAERKLEGETILITGGATGIGKAVARAATTKSAEVNIIGRRE